MSFHPINDATLWAAIFSTFMPFVSFVLIMTLTRSRRRLSAGLSLGAITVSLACSIFLLCSNWGIEKPIQYTGRWLASSSIAIPYGFLLDPVSLVMLVIVAAISFLVQTYSLGYMAGDAGFSRYYAFMSLFAWAMLSLTLSPTLLQLYIFWELVGLSSYLLIGFWYEKFSATQAGKKAFVMTRAGDVAFFLGIILILLHLGNLNILEVNGAQSAEAMSPTMITLAALLIFGGIAGKSAQFPLLTWLPDAMEGPTPVSALLHSATMVAAGVYLFARLFPFFSLSPTAMGVFLTIGTISMFLASTMAMVDRDIKKVWAYSTISQLGFMIMALAAGGREGYFAGIFHLTTHAGFKALLFLCSGVFIHSYHTNDIYELGRQGARSLKVPTITICIAAAALAGLPPLSGFFSKEAIMVELAGLSNPVWLVAALSGVFMTAYYAFRVIFVVFFSPLEEDQLEMGQVSSGHAHNSDHHLLQYWVMACPLILLAFVTVFLGLCEVPLRHFLIGRFGSLAVHDGGGPSWVPYTALCLAVCGVGLAWLEFGRREARQIGFVERIPALSTLFAQRWYLDHLYRLLVDRLIDKGISYLFYKNDNKVIDGSIDQMCRGTLGGGRFVALLHLGMIQYRLLAAFAVLVLLSLYFFL